VAFSVILVLNCTFVHQIILPVAKNVWKEPEDNEEAATSPHFTAHRRVPKVAEEKLWLVLNVLFCCVLRYIIEHACDACLN